MEVSVVLSQTIDFPFRKVERLLTEKGYTLSAVLCVSESGFVDAVRFARGAAQTVAVIGFTDSFFESVRDKYLIDASARTFVIDGVTFALADAYSDAFITETVIPLLNAKCKTFYSTVRFQTFGKNEEELRTILKEQIRNRNRIAFFFYPSACACEVAVRYSNKMAKTTVDEMIASVAEKLNDCVYGYGDTTLSQAVVDLLRARGLKVCLAESFTGGNIAAALVSVAGASEVFYEGIVCYDKQSKVLRLGVDGKIIEQYGAVSDETAYEMAAGLLMQGHCDIAVATTGNAGPTAEKEGDVGRCYVSVGDKQAVHIYAHAFNGTRAENIEAGTQHALFALYKTVKKSALETMLESQQAQSEK